MSEPRHSPVHPGKVISVHPVGSLGPVYPVLAVLLVAVAGTLAFYIVNAEMVAMEKGLAILIRICGGIFCLLAVAILYRWYKFRGSSLTLMENGLAYSTRGKSRFHPWRDVHSISVRCEKAHSFPVPRTAVTLKLAGNVRLKLKDIYKNVFTLGLNILKLTASEKTPEAIVQIERGKTLSFGALKANKDGISKLFGKIRWSEIESAELIAGILTIRKKGARLAWSRPYAFQVENLLVFINVLQHYSQADPGILISSDSIIRNGN